ncbi:hypothetical protein Flavo103_11370 [Flavobacterium collinsii]|nr:hypothetical protein Flavo103_11370 [Flavobacterium collinsii]
MNTVLFLLNIKRFSGFELILTNYLVNHFFAFKKNKRLVHITRII